MFYKKLQVSKMAPLFDAAVLNAFREEKVRKLLFPGVPTPAGLLLLDDNPPDTPEKIDLIETISTCTTENCGKLVVTYSLPIWSAYRPAGPMNGRNGQPMCAQHRGELEDAVAAMLEDWIYSGGNPQTPEDSDLEDTCSDDSVVSRGRTLRLVDGNHPAFEGAREESEESKSSSDSDTDTDTDGDFGGVSLYESPPDSDSDADVPRGRRLSLVDGMHSIFEAGREESGERRFQEYLTSQEAASQKHPDQVID